MMIAYVWIEVITRDMEALIVAHFFIKASTSATVSYTHLDVYKRQALGRIQGPNKGIEFLGRGNTYPMYKGLERFFYIILHMSTLFDCKLILLCRNFCNLFQMCIRDRYLAHFGCEQVNPFFISLCGSSYIKI